MIEKIENRIKENIVFLYTNLYEEDAMIEPSQIREIYKVLSNLSPKYEKINIVLNTNGGNLAAGSKIANIFREYFNYINMIVLEKCSSTGTFILLSGDEVQMSRSSIITPTEPQIKVDNDIVSTCEIRNYLQNYKKNRKGIKKIDPLIYANYHSTISYFKDLCYNTYEKSKADKIIDYMLNKVNSHQFPLTKKELEKWMLR